MSTEAGTGAPQPAEGENTPHDLAYRHTRRNLLSILTDRTECADVPVPACPGWTVSDTVAHLVANCRQAERNLLGRPDHGRTPAGLAGMLSEWERSAAGVERGIRRARSRLAGSVLVMDAFTHEFDIRTALGVSLPVWHAATRSAFQMAVDGFGTAVSCLGRPPLRLETEDGAWNVGSGAPSAVVFGTTHDLYRSLVGRRTAEQIGQLSWTAEPAPWMPAFTWGPFTPPVVRVE